MNTHQELSAKEERLIRNMNEMNEEFEDLGTLEIGKQADLIVLDQNLFEIPTNEIAKTKVLLTLVDGREVYRASNWSIGESKRYPC